MSSEKQGGRDLKIDLTNHVFENEINKFTKNRGQSPLLPLRLLWPCNESLEILENFKSDLNNIKPIFISHLMFTHLSQ